MALIFPYSLAFFSDTARILRTDLDLRRFDETSGGGDGRFWSVQMATPLWSADVILAAMDARYAREFSAKVKGLDGARNSFLFADQTYTGPASGVTTGLGSVTISAISADRGSINVTGLPEGFVLTAGDRFSVTYQSGARYFFGEFSENGVAGASGSFGAVRPIRPYLPLGVTTGASVELVKPRFKAMIQPGGWTPFTYELPGDIATGASMRILQRP